MITQEYIYNSKIINVVDGDTVDVLIDLGFYVSIRQRVRLYGIDTPELNSTDQVKRAIAVQAKAFVVAFNGFGRFLAEIFFKDDPISLNEKLINSGLAVPYSGGIRV